MRHVGWDNKDASRGETMGDAADGELQLTFEDIDHLLLRVLMLGEACAGISLNPRFRCACAVHHTCPKSRKNLANGNRFEGHNAHPVRYITFQAALTSWRYHCT